MAKKTAKVSGTLVWDGKPVVPEKWGKDHLSTLIYIESCIVDGNGTPNADKMRTKTGSPRGQFRSPRPSCEGGEYPTVLSDGTLLSGHDDWDCVDDMEKPGVVVWGGTGLNPVFSLTDIGWELAGRIRRHLGERYQGHRAYKGLDVVSILAKS